MENPSHRFVSVHVTTDNDPIIARTDDEQASWLLEHLPRLRPALLVLLAFMAFGSACGYGLLHGWDDTIYVTNNVSRLSFSVSNIGYWLTHDCASCYLPLTMFSYMFDYAVWELNAVGYHLQNLVWHCVAVLALYGCFRTLRMNSWVALFCAAMFAVHPQRVESVVWISERKDVMCAAFYALAALVYLRDRARNRYPWRAIPLFLCALLSKSMAVTLPAVLVVYEVARAARVEPMRLLRNLWCYALLAVACVPVAVHFQSVPGDATTRAHQLFTAFHNLWWYALKTFVPAALRPIHPRLEVHAVLVLALIAASVLTLVTSVYLFRAQREIFLRVVAPCLTAYALALAPVSGIVPLGFTDFSDRYSYIPSAFLWMLVGLGITALLHQPSTAAKISRLRGFLAFVACVAVLASALHTTAYATAWRDIHTLHATSCAVKPANVFSLGQLGDIELENGEFMRVGAIGQRLLRADRTWMTSEARERAQNKGRYLVGIAAHSAGDTTAALEHLEPIIPLLDTTIFHIPTNNVAVWGVLADCYLRTGQMDKALAAYDSIVQRVPTGDYQAPFYRGVKAQVLDQPAEALRYFRQAASLRPDIPLIQINIQRCQAALANRPREKPNAP